MSGLPWRAVPFSILIITIVVAASNNTSLQSAHLVRPQVQTLNSHRQVSIVHIIGNIFAA